MLAEACVALALVGVVLGVVSLMMARYGRAADYYLNYRRVQLAAESQMEMLRAGARPVEDADFTGDAGISYQIRVTDAEDAWKPLRHVSVTATVTAKHGREVRCEVEAHVAPGGTTKGGGP